MLYRLFGYLKIPANHNFPPPFRETRKRLLQTIWQPKAVHSVRSFLAQKNEKNYHA